MSVVLPSQYKIPCPFCKVEIKVVAECVGQLSVCPHCQEEITLDLPTSSALKGLEPNVLSPATVRLTKAGISREMIGVGYLLAILFPVIGFIFGVHFLIKEQFGHGFGCIIVSLFGAGLWYGVLTAFSSW